MDKLLFYAQSLVLGVVEGCTEFLPVSSTGHLIVFEALLGFQGRTRYVETYSYVIQLGAVLAVAVLYRRQIGASLQAFWPRGGLQPRPWAETGLYFWLSLALACLPGLLATLLLGSLADAFFSQPGWVALALILGGAALCLAERFWARPAAARPALPWPRVSMGQALTVGAFQCLAVLPGVSRSASTIIGGWFAGLDTTASAAFSFFLAMPVMAGMSALKLIQLGGFAAMDPVELTGLGIGFAVSFLTALLVVKRFTAYVAKQGMVLFGVYRTVFGFLILAALASGSLAPAA